MDKPNKKIEVHYGKEKSFQEALLELIIMKKLLTANQGDGSCGIFGY